MAKKETKGFSFGDVQKLVENISKKTSITVENSRVAASYISTGIHVMDALLAKSITHGGVSKNRITIFAGDPGTGKSYICYNLARNAQKEGYSVVYIDTEYSASLETFQGFGIDTDIEKFMLISSNNVESIRIALTQLLSELKTQKESGVEIPKMIMFLDSIGNLASNKEIADALEGNNKQDMSRAKVLKSLFRIVSSDLGYLDIPLICTNHIYMTMDLFPKAVMNGGKGAEYAASAIVYLTNAKLKSGNEDPQASKPSEADVISDKVKAAGKFVESYLEELKVAFGSNATDDGPFDDAQIQNLAAACAALAGDQDVETVVKKEMDNYILIQMAKEKGLKNPEAFASLVLQAMSFKDMVTDKEGSYAVLRGVLSKDIDELNKFFGKSDGAISQIDNAVVSVESAARVVAASNNRRRR
jgi:RecA/RadA recombinase